MKNILLIAIVCLFAACKQDGPPKDYAVIHGKITNPIEKTNIRLYDPISSESIIIEVDENGSYSDTLKLKEPVYYTVVYNNIFYLYLENDMDIEINFDGDNIGKTISFVGTGSEENDFLRYKSTKSSELMGENYKDYLALENNAFDARTFAYSKDLTDKLDNENANLSSNFIASEKENIAKFEKDIQAQHQEQLEINAVLSPGMITPPFTDYLNYKGGTNDLADYKGKYVYIDVWATWCVPCIVEMPYMNEIEKQYANKNIQFIGLSIDNPEKDEQKWRDMIVDKELHGTQLLADNQIDSKFIRDYYIYGIPRFILLDPQGKIISYDAPRPSEPRLKELFNSLDIK
jgi:thiol-disulfide isomerase/thioredoxin